jgi:hypothetical protein
MDMSRQPIEKRAGETLAWKTLVHLLERQIRRDDGRAAFMTLAEDLESSSAPVWESGQSRVP